MSSPILLSAPSQRDLNSPSLCNRISLNPRISMAIFLELIDTLRDAILPSIQHLFNTNERRKEGIQRGPVTQSLIGSPIALKFRITTLYTHSTYFSFPSSYVLHIALKPPPHTPSLQNSLSGVIRRAESLEGSEPYQADDNRPSRVGCLCDSLMQTFERAQLG
ncbi:hypothetical protein NLI96_g12093 [Meripilus lineatus]|uniref:Uncharacterized protein n=1 Tax=Meripilus lineatus TaxID=2056292 RepID=A0AAD5Y8I8_9APHY|nr:hypothetical protein NLI96_g12093 [Physisporinus lineatus]